MGESQSLGNLAFFSTVAARLAQCLYLQRRFDEVQDLCAIVRETSPPGDLVNFVFADALEGCLLSRDDRHAEAEVLLRQAVDRVETTDFFFARSETRLLHAEALFRAGKAAAASRAAALGISLLDEKGDVSGAANARERLDGLGIALA